MRAAGEAARRLRLLHASRGVSCGHAPSSLPACLPTFLRSSLPRDPPRRRRNPYRHPLSCQPNAAPLSHLRCALHEPAARRDVIRRRPFRPERNRGIYARTKTVPISPVKFNCDRTSRWYLFFVILHWTRFCSKMRNSVEVYRWEAWRNKENFLS